MLRVDATAGARPSPLAARFPRLPPGARRTRGPGRTGSCAHQPGPPPARVAHVGVLCAGRGKAGHPPGGWGWARRPGAEAAGRGGGGGEPRRRGGGDSAWKGGCTRICMKHRLGAGGSGSGSAAHAPGRPSERASERASREGGGKRGGEAAAAEGSAHQSERGEQSLAGGWTFLPGGGTQTATPCGNPNFLLPL